MKNAPSQIVIVDDHSGWAEIYIDFLKSFPKTREISTQICTSFVAAEEHIRSNSSSILGYILDLYLGESFQEGRYEGIKLFNEVILPLTPWAKTIFVSALGTANQVRDIFMRGRGQVDILNKASFDREEFEKIAGWLLEPSLPSETPADPASQLPITELLHLVSPPWQEICRHIALHPNFLHSIDPRKFEFLVAEIYKDFGWTVELTTETRDGGFDIIAIRRNFPTSQKVLIEAKRYSPEKPVGVSIVRSLYGVRALNSVSQVVLATSSYVSADAKKEFSQVVPWALDFLERDELLEWCRSYGRVSLKGDFFQTK